MFPGLGVQHLNSDNQYYQKLLGVQIQSRKPLRLYRYRRVMP
jgi:hypothetical protein